MPEENHCFTLVAHYLIVLSSIVIQLQLLIIFSHFNVHYHNDKKIYTQCATQINVGTGQSQMSLCEDVFNC